MSQRTLLKKLLLVEVVVCVGEVEEVINNLFLRFNFVDNVLATFYFVRDGLCNIHFPLNNDEATDAGKTKHFGEPFVVITA